MLRLKPHIYALSLFSLPTYNQSCAVRLNLGQHTSFPSLSEINTFWWPEEILAISLLLWSFFCLSETYLTHPVPAVSPQQLVGPHQNLPLGLWLLQDQNIAFSFQPVVAREPTTLWGLGPLNGYPELVHCNKMRAIFFINLLENIWLD